jgi:hypothetical protein
MSETLEVIRAIKDSGRKRASEPRRSEAAGQLLELQKIAVDAHRLHPTRHRHLRRWISSSCSPLMRSTARLTVESLALAVSNLPLMASLAAFIRRKKAVSATGERATTFTNNRPPGRKTAILRE